MTPTKQPTQRLFYADAIRMCAGFFVAVSHVFAPICAGFNAYSRPVWWVFNLCDSIIRPSASLFIMISGAIFLGSTRDESYFRFVWKRYARIFLPFFTWSVIYALYEASPEGPRETVSALGHSVLLFLQGPTQYHLWFMYVILALYLVTPLLRRFVRAATPHDLAVLLGLWFGFLTLQFIFPGCAGDGPAVTLLGYGGFFVLGYVLNKVNLSRLGIQGLTLLMLGIVGLNAWETYSRTLRQAGTLDEKFYQGVAPLVVLHAAAFFLILKNINYESIFAQRPWLRGFVTRMSRESYNVYLIHPFFIWLLTNGLLGFVLSQDTGASPLVGVALTSAAVLSGSLGLSFALQKIPGLSRFFVISSPKKSKQPARDFSREKVMVAEPVG